MDYQVLMGALHGRADLAEEFDARARAEAAGGAKGVDGGTLYILHHQVRTAVGGAAAIEQASYIRMIEARQDLALVTEPPQQVGGIHAARHQFDSDLFFELLVVAL